MPNPFEFSLIPDLLTQPERVKSFVRVYRAKEIPSDIFAIGISLTLIFQNEDRVHPLYM